MTGTTQVSAVTHAPSLPLAAAKVLRILSVFNRVHAEGWIMDDDTDENGTLKTVAFLVVILIAGWFAYHHVSYRLMIHHWVEKLGDQQENPSDEFLLFGCFGIQKFMSQSASIQY